MVYTCRIFKSQILHPKISKKIVLHSIQFFLPDRFFTQALPLVPLTNIRYDFNISIWSSAYFDRFSILVLEEKCCSWSWDIPPYLMEYLWGFEVVPNFGQARQKGTNLHRMATTMNYMNYMILQFAQYIAHWIILDLFGWCFILHNLTVSLI